MLEIKDDPCQVLVLLNSMGFVGITADQLKGFMKELKIYRKINHHERQQWKGEMKQKIIRKQKEQLTELLTGNIERDTVQLLEDSVVEIKIQCISDSDSNNKAENKDTNIKVCPLLNSVNATNNSMTQTNVTSLIKPSRKARATTLPRTVSAPDLSQPLPRISQSMSATSEPIGRPRSARNPSKCSSRPHSKSFIRPWKLNPEIERAAQTATSDPVALYSNYQKEWKQISFPGENRHAEIRWAVREKMLGTNPIPRPILRKSCSTRSVKPR